MSNNLPKENIWLTCLQWTEGKMVANQHNEQQPHLLYLINSKSLHSSIAIWNLKKKIYGSDIKQLQSYKSKHSVMPVQPH